MTIQHCDDNSPDWPVFCHVGCVLEADMSSTLNYPQGCSHVHSLMMKLPTLVLPPVLSWSSLGPFFFFCVFILALDMVLPVYLEVGFNSTSLLSVLTPQSCDSADVRAPYFINSPFSFQSAHVWSLWTLLQSLWPFASTSITCVHTQMHRYISLYCEIWVLILVIQTEIKEHTFV